MDSHTHKPKECDRLLSLISSASECKEYKTLFADTADSFGKSIIFDDPESLSRVRTRDTKDRRASWTSLLEFCPKTDIGILVALSFFGGMLSPSNTSRFARVQPDSLDSASEWLGLANMIGLVGAALQDHGDTDQNEVRDAISYFNHMVGPAFA